MPGPILLGAIFDVACLLYQETCEGQGSCWVYDTQFISEGIVWACLVVKSVSGLSFLLALICYKAPDNTSDEINMIVEEEKGKQNLAVIDGKNMDSFLSNATDEHTYM